MKHLVIMFIGLAVSGILSAQGFPDAQKQPKLKEQRPNQNKFRKWSHRRHVKRGTVYMEPYNATNTQTGVCVLIHNKALNNFA